MSWLHRVAPYEMSMRVWGYDLAGHMTEISAMVAEGHVEPVDYHPDPGEAALTTRTHYWDHDETWRRSIVRIIDSQAQPTPYGWCLPYLVEAA